MPDATTPQGSADDTVLSFDQGADDISNLLADPVTDLEEEDQGQEANSDDAGDETESEDEADEQEEDTVDADDSDGSEEVKGGRFAPDTAKVTLEDGTVITVAELKRNNLFQRDYTRKTTEHKEAVKAFEQHQVTVGNHAKALAAQRDFLLQAAKQFLPAPPDRAMINTDIFGYQNALADYQEKMGVINQLHQQSQADQDRIAQEMEGARKEAVRLEAQKLTEVMPELAKPENYQKFWSETVDTMAGYGFSAEELNESANDHRFYKVFRDLMKYRKAIQQAPKVRENVQGKPKLISGGKRMDPKAKTSREAQARSQKLRSSGSIQDGIAALMDLDL